MQATLIDKENDMKNTLILLITCTLLNACSSMYTAVNASNGGTTGRVGTSMSW